MKFCLTHFRWEVWIQDLCYAWLTGEADEADQLAFWEDFVHKVYNTPVAIIALDPQPERCRFEEKILA